MKTPLSQKLIHGLRSRTPLRLRQKIGPVIALTLYLVNVHIRKNRSRPNVLSIHDTIEAIIKGKLSVIRFGDGEISVIDGLSIAFQKRSPQLVQGLENVLESNHSGLLICIPGIWDRLDNLEKYAYWFNMHHVYRHGHIWKKLLVPGQTYGDTNITRPYLAYKDKSNAREKFNHLFKIWESADVFLIEGSQSRLGVGNDMFDNAKSVERLLCPPENAFAKIDAIKAEAMKVSKNKLILLSLGPTAKILAYDLFMLGYRVIDVGHIDMEYEMFLRKHRYLTKVPNKYFNEINERTPEDCHDERYLSQIRGRIE